MVTTRVPISSSTPLVTVIVPTYNRANFISKALESLMSQTFNDFEVIICDDGSTDNTQEVIESISKSFTFSYKYISLNHQGVAKARNVGIDLSRGQYIAFLDSDDTYHPRKLGAQVDLLEREPNTVFCYTGYKLINTGICVDPGKFNLDRYLLGNYLCCASVMIRRDILLKTGGYDPELKLAEDWDLLIRLALMGNAIGIADPLYEYFSHPGQSINQVDLLNHYTDIVRHKYSRLERFSSADMAEPYLKPSASSTKYAQVTKALKVKLGL